MRIIAVLLLLASAREATSRKARIGSNWNSCWASRSEPPARKSTPNGPGGGAFSFEPDLNKKIIVRRNNASYDSGLKHDDLMVIYTEGGTRAIYFDGEGHVIRYNVSAPSVNRVVFESDGTQPGPKYRLSYWLDGGSLDGKFEIATSAERIQDLHELDFEAKLTAGAPGSREHFDDLAFGQLGSLPAS